MQFSKYYGVLCLPMCVSICFEIVFVFYMVLMFVGMGGATPKFPHHKNKEASWEPIWSRLKAVLRTNLVLKKCCLYAFLRNSFLVQGFPCRIPTVPIVVP